MLHRSAIRIHDDDLPQVRPISIRADDHQLVAAYADSWQLQELQGIEVLIVQPEIDLTLPIEAFDADSGDVAGRPGTELLVTANQKRLPVARFGDGDRVEA